jgi:hypothetical protein
MKTTITLNAFASSVTLALSLGLATAAQAGDFDFGHPELDQQKAAKPLAAPVTPPQAAAQRVAADAALLKREPRSSVSTEESRAMLGEDSGSFWLSQQMTQPRSASAVARLEAGKR